MGAEEEVEEAVVEVEEAVVEAEEEEALDIAVLVTEDMAAEELVLEDMVDLVVMVVMVRIVDSAVAAMDKDIMVAWE
jgi:hypothetical protein